MDSVVCQGRTWELGSISAYSAGQWAECDICWMLKENPFNVCSVARYFDVLFEDEKAKELKDRKLTRPFVPLLLIPLQENS